MFWGQGMQSGTQIAHPPQKLASLSIGGPLPQASPVSVYLFPGERSGAQPHLPPVVTPAGSLGSRSEAKEDEKEEGDGDTLDSDEFCILDAPGLGIPVCGGQAGQGQDVVGRGGPLLHPCRAHAAGGVGGGLCRWGGGSGSVAVSLTLGFEEQVDFQRKRERMASRVEGQDIEGRQEEERGG